MTRQGTTLAALSILLASLTLAACGPRPPPKPAPAPPQVQPSE